MTLRESLEVIGKQKEIALLGVGFVYFLGYSVWALVAWNNKLGPLPALDSQYFVAGLPTALALILTVGLIAASKHFLLRLWPRWLGLFPPLRVGLRVIVPLLIPALVAIDWLAPGAFERTFARLHYSAIFVLIYVGVLVFVAYQRTEKRVSSEHTTRIGRILLKAERASGKLSDFYAIFILPISAGLIALTSYVGEIYPAIPQSLGGAKPRCAVLDIAPESFSPQTLQELGISTEVGSAVRTTADLKIMFLSDSVILARVSSPTKLATRLEIGRDSITAIRWCD